MTGDEIQQAQKAGGYTVEAENGRTIKYLMQKPDESYDDYMKRAVEYGKTVTQEDIDAETHQPKKVVKALTHGAEYGVEGGAILTGVGEAWNATATAGRAALGYLASETGKKVLTTAGTWAAKKILEGAGLGLGYKILKWTGIL